MQTFFLLSFINLLKIRSSNQVKEKIDLYFTNKEYVIYDFTKYIVFKEFEEIPYEKNIEMLNDKNAILNYILKYYFTFYESILVCGGFENFFDYWKKYYFFNSNLTQKMSIIKYKTHKSNLDIIRNQFNFINMSAENIKNFYYFSNYLKNINQTDLDNFLKKKEYHLTDFIDLLDLKDDNLIKKLKKEKSKKY